ncbi:MAG: hypothetical protein ACRDTR_12300 [Rubrobacter sp.]
MSKTLHKHYDRLEPEERFRLDVRAMARGDVEESERLVSTCPRRPYTMTDVEFSGRWNALLSLTPRAFLPLSEYLGKLEMVELFRAATDAESAEAGAFLDEVERRIARGALAYWVAFAGFCSEVVGVEADQALDIVLGEAAVEGARTITDLAERLELEADAEEIAGLRADFERGWRLIEEQGA